MKKIHTLILIFALFTAPVFAQYRKAEISKEAAASHLLPVHPLRSAMLTEARSMSSNMISGLPDWNPSMVSIAKIHELPADVAREIEVKTQDKIRNNQSSYPDESPLDSPLNSPQIGNNFAGNIFNGMTPPDNSMAISNGGIVVTVNNSTLEYYSTGGTQLFSSSFANFFNDPTLTGAIYDPVVLYDSGSDRFFMAVLHGSTSSLSKVILCFSKTNNPSDGWWYYKLTGNPLNNSCWFDYPKIGVSNNEVYVTGNLFSDASVYNQSVIYQVTKAGGYNGTSISWQYWYNISNSPFTMGPASYGQQGNYGPGIYLVATNENAASDNYYFLDLTDDLTGSPSLNVSSITASFSVAGNAIQNGTSTVLNTGDTRGLSAFYLPGMVHFVFNSEVYTNYSGINYNRITVSSLTNWNSTFGLDGYDYAYPSVASFGTSNTDKSVIIAFLRSNSGIYPECRVVYCDNAGTWSGSTQVKAGETYVNVYQSGGVTRWGDYSGCARRQNSSPPEAWLSGCYGASQSGEHALNTWIAQITGVTTGVAGSGHKNPEGVSVYPNPSSGRVNVEFTLDHRMLVDISLLDLSGKTIKVLMKDMAEEGKNLVSFNKSVLPAGIYFVQVSSANKTLAHEKIIIE